MALALGSRESLLKRWSSRHSLCLCARERSRDPTSRGHWRERLRPGSGPAGWLVADRRPRLLHHDRESSGLLRPRALHREGLPAARHAALPGLRFAGWVAALLLRLGP